MCARGVRPARIFRAICDRNDEFLDVQRTDIFRTEPRQLLGIARDFAKISLTHSMRVVRRNFSWQEYLADLADVLPAGMFSLKPYEKYLERLMARHNLPRRFDELSRPYYALRRGEMGAGERLDAALAELDGLLEMQPFLSGHQFGLADVAYVPWILRARDRMDVELTPFPALADWVTRLEQRPSIVAELDVVASL